MTEYYRCCFQNLSASDIRKDPQAQLATADVILDDSFYVYPSLTGASLSGKDLMTVMHATSRILR